MKKIFLSFVAILFYSCPSLEEDNYTKCDESHSYPYWTDWTDGNLISIIDDSLAAVSTLKYKKECLGYNREDIVSFRTGLLVNYRTRQKPLMGDTLELEYEVLNSYYMYLVLKILNGYLFRDTSALILDVKNSKFGFWKIGEKSIKFRDHNKVSSDYSTFISKIDTLNLKFDKDFSLWIDEKPLTFCKNGDKNPDDCVSYSGQDLINFKGDKP